MHRIYLDHASSTPPDPEVREAMRPFLEDRFANPSSPHRRGAAARRAIDEAREEVAGLLGCPAGEIVFTGSATEANNLALKGAASASTGRRHLVAPATEHLSILHPLRTLERQGFRVTLLPVDRHGLVDLDDLRAALAPDTLLVSAGHASGEIGTLQPLAAICRAAHARNLLVHTDATLTAGLLPWTDGEDRPDLVTLTGHLMYGPQGVGALRVPQGIRIAPLIEGGVQEGGLRAGTEAVAAIIGFGVAARRAAAEMGRRAARASALADRLRLILLAGVEGLVPTGHPRARLPGHLSFCVRGLEAEALLRALDDAGVEAASGSPCTTGARKASHVLEAIGVDPVVARGALVLSFGEANREDDPEAAGMILAEQIARLRALSPLPCD